jgi:hypothetical protein
MTQKMVLAVVLAALGVLLVVPAVWNRALDPMRDADMWSPLKPLAEVPISQSEGQKSVDLVLTLPNDAVWKRTRQYWGDPDYTVALVSSHGEYQHCFDGLNVRVVHGESQVSLRNAHLFYGYSPRDSDIDCKSLGESFQVPLGSKIHIHLTAESDHVAPYTNVIVSADWHNTKDLMVGLDLDKDFRTLERWYENRMAVLGLIMILSAAFLFVHERLQAKHRRDRPVDASL